MKKLATINIYIDPSLEDTQGITGSFTSPEKFGPEDVYNITLKVNQDAAIMNRLTNRSVPFDEVTKTTLAHELGHVVEYLGRDEAHHVFYRALFGTGEAEEHAWKRAHDIYPNLSTQQEKLAMSTDISPIKVSAEDIQSPALKGE